MSQISQKSISGITSITSPAGTDDQISLHTSNTNEALKIDGAGNLHLNNHVNTTGVTTASNFKTGSSNLHSTGLTVGDTFVHATGVNGSSADIDDFISVGNNIHLGNAGVITATTVNATSFVGSGAQLTGIVGGKFNGPAAGILTTSTVGIQTANVTSADLVGAATSMVGLYIGDGHLLFSNYLNKSGGYYITTGLNALNAGPVTLGSTMTLDGTWVIV